MRTHSKTFILLLAGLFTYSGCHLSQEHTTTDTNGASRVEQKENTTPTIVEEVQQPPTRVEPPRPSGVTAAHAAEMTMTSGIVLRKKVGAMVQYDSSLPWQQPSLITESYTPVTESGFIKTKNDPLSTFSIDVDTASYANIRRFINQNRLPPVGAVRVEEMINYFSYDYPQPTEGPFSVTTEVGPSPWQSDYKVVRIGLQAKNIDSKDLPPSNLVFLIDVSGSMHAAAKLPLLKQSMHLLVDQLSDRDRVAIVVYAGSERVVLQPTGGEQKQRIKAAIDSLGAGGSTHGSQGILTAYQLAKQSYMPKGNNRIILASDGDFNVGVTSRGELQKLIEEKRKSGIYLTTLGFGTGNYHDDTMEILANKGNGNYGYIDSLLEAKKMLVKEMSGNMFALANDVKIQVEFNPAKVGAYRLIGYENRALADEDFNDDRKDAGEIGVGHRVTALYEIIPTGHASIPDVDPLKYQQTATGTLEHNSELMTIKLRYKPQGSKKSVSIDQVVHDPAEALISSSIDFHFATAVSSFGMLLKQSDHINGFGFKDVLQLARKGKGNDPEGYRAEFIRLVEMAELLQKSVSHSNRQTSVGSNPSFQYR